MQSDDPKTTSKALPWLFLFMFTFCPFIAAAFYSSAAAISSIEAMAAFPSSNELKQKDFANKSPAIAKRMIQQHFRHYNTYVPIENIMLKIEQENPVAAETLNLMKTSTGDSDIWIFVPLRFHFPFIGDKVVDYLFKPEINAPAESKALKESKN